MPYKQSNGINLYYEIQGKGDYLVIIPGLGTDITEYKSFVGPLSKNNTVVIADNRGAGRSDKPKEPYTIEMMAKDLNSLLESLKIKSANVMGISMGGRIALDLALKHQDKVNKLILVSTSARTISTWKRNIYLLLARMPILQSKYPMPRYAFKNQLEATGKYNGSKYLKELQKPTLILHGTRDRITPLKLGIELHKKIKGSKLIAFKGGHIFFFLREKDSFLTTVKNYL